MAKTSATYAQVADACQELLGDGQTIKLRSIIAITGGSPNKVLQHWQQWQKEQGEATLKEIEEDLSSEIKQAIRAECARKTRLIKTEYDHFKASFDQQLKDRQGLLDGAVKENDELCLEIATLKDKLLEQKKETNLLEQQVVDYAKRLKESEKQWIQAEKSAERAITEKTMLEKQMLALQERLKEEEQKYIMAASEKHRIELE